MNNNFVKDNLLPNEQIIATAEWHWMKKWLTTIVLIVASFAFFIASYYESVNLKDARIQVLEEQVRYSYKSPFPKDYENNKRVLENVKSYSPWDWWSSTDTGTISIICLALAIVSIFISGELNKHDEFAITNLRVVAKVGLIRRIAFELHIEQVESIEISQGVFGRELDYGTLIPRGVGASNVRIRFVKDPFEFRQHFFDLKRDEQKVVK